MSPPRGWAVACVVGWVVGAIVSRHVGMWNGMGTTSALLGAASLVIASRTLPLRPSVRDALVGLAAGAVMVGGTYALFALVERRAPSLLGDTLGLYSAFRALPRLTGVALLVPVIVGEELVWRGVVQGALQDRISPVVAALIATILYTLAHAPLGSPVLALAALGCGLCFSLLRAYTNAMWAPILAHFVWDLMILSVHPLA